MAGVADRAARQELAQALVSLRALGRDVDADTFLPHAHATDQLAAHEVARTAVDSLRAQAVEQVIVGTVVYAAALPALRRVAHEHHSARGNSSGGPAAGDVE